MDDAGVIDPPERFNVTAQLPLVALVIRLFDNVMPVAVATISPAKFTVHPFMASIAV